MKGKQVIYTLQDGTYNPHILRKRGQNMQNSFYCVSQAVEILS
jgi:hypothetical protein